MSDQCLKIAFYCLLLTWSSGCSHIAYYSQAIQGHFDLMSRREPIVEILDDAQRGDGLVKQLRIASDIRDFASHKLALPDNGSYRSYVDVERPYVTWAVYAAPELSLTPTRWCFPIAGCVLYRGYFSEQRARSFADSLADQGLDVYVAGVTAYSTLGWFDDPLLNTMIWRGETVMAGLIFHELAHQRLYVDSDTAFNEAFAVAVQQEGVRLWLKRNRGKDAVIAFEQVLKRQQDFYGLLEGLRQRLAVIYESDSSDRVKRNAKWQSILDADKEYRKLKLSWGGYSGYDGWFAEPINNARLASVAVYLDRVPAFTRLLETCGGDFRLFYLQVQEIARLPSGEREKRLGLAGIQQ
jgi:predicted aminopeptidase